MAISFDEIQHLAKAISVSAAAGGCGALCGGVIDLGLEMVRKYRQSQGGTAAAQSEKVVPLERGGVQARLCDLTESLSGLDYDIPMRFAAQAETRPNEVALVAENEGLPTKITLTFAELRSKVLVLAEHLRHRDTSGAQGSDLMPGQLLVAVCLKRSAALIVALLAVQEAGAACVPLDPIFPVDRRLFALEDSGAGLLMVEEDATWTGGFPEQKCVRLRWPSGDLLFNVEAKPGRVTTTAGKAAYMLYTSGSTGTPKGVLVHRSGVISIMKFFEEEMRGGGKVPGAPKDVLAAVTTYCFDVSVMEIYWPLCFGFRLALASAETARSGPLLSKFMAEEKATLFLQTPASYRMLLKAGWTGSPHLNVMCCGETFPISLAQALPPICGGVWNGYGPTETTIYSTTYKLGPELDGALPIGKAVAGTALLLAEVESAGGDEEAGELLIGGDGVTIGYNRRPELTATKYVTLPYVEDWGRDKRVFRSGDLVRQMAGQKDFKFLGRIDCQVKIRGWRIELGEVESRLEVHPAVRAAVAETLTDAAEERWLVAFVQLKPGASPDGLEGELKEHLSRTVPHYMVPRRIVVLEAFPLGGTGKVDRKAIRGLAHTEVPEEDAGETVLDSLGIAQIQSRSHAAEDLWMCNMQAFWILVVLLIHLRPVGGRDYQAKVTTLRFYLSLGHGKVMAAFMFLLGLKDSRTGPQLKGRDLVVLGIAVALTTFLAPLLAVSFWPSGVAPGRNSEPMMIHAEWFLYAYVIGRCLVALLSALKVPAALQGPVAMGMAALVPEAALQSLVGQYALDNLFWWIRFQGLRFTFLFMPAFFITSFHSAQPLMELVRRANQARNGRWTWALGAFCWSAFVTLCLLTARIAWQYGGDPWAQRLVPDAWSDATYPNVHAVIAVWPGHPYYATWEYLTSGGLGTYLALYVLEVFSWAWGVALVGIAISLWPFQLTLLGSTTFGTFVIHNYQSGAAWQVALYKLVTNHITDPSNDYRVNAMSLFLWGIVFSAVFSLTLGAGFYHLVAGLSWLVQQLWATVQQRCMQPGERDRGEEAELVGLLEGGEGTSSGRLSTET